MRAPHDRVALALHLSRMPAPGPRPHHRRIARAVLDDAAQRQEGQVFALANDDLLLLFRPHDGAGALRATLAELFGADAPLDPAGLLTLWSLDRDGTALLRYAEARLLDALPDPARFDPALAEPKNSAQSILALESVIEDGRITDLAQRQTGVLLAPGRDARLQPLFQEVSFSAPVLEARIAAAGQARTDPFLFRHLASRLDGRMLDALRRDLQANGPLTAGARGRGPALHLDLTLSGILSDPFAQFAAACRAVGAQVAVEIPLVEACADPEAFMAARTRLRFAGLALVLDGVSHHALMLTVPTALEPDLVKLDWSPRLPEAGAAVARAVAALGGSRVVLHRADTEDALGWGLAHGIRRFQGRWVDAMLAAKRIGACGPGRCSVRQCAERASATGPAGRAGCGNQALLDAAVPAGAWPLVAA